MIEEKPRTTEEIAQAHKACLDGADTINVIIATHAKGSDATDADFSFDLTHDEKKARVRRGVSYLKYQKEIIKKLIRDLIRQSITGKIT